MERPSGAPPEPGPQPHDAAPTSLVINIRDFADTDSNGYLDSGLVTVYLFADGYALPIATRGRFTFILSDPTGPTIAEWPIPQDLADARRIKTQVGPGFAFGLDLRTVGAEKCDRREAVLVGVFEDAKGRRIRSGRLTVTIGRAR